MKQLTTTIFLSDNRLSKQSDIYRSYSTFSEAPYQHTHHDHAELYVLNDEELLAGAVREIRVPENSYVLLLPVTGDLRLDHYQKTSETINVGEIKILSQPQGSMLKLTNPFDQEIINYLVLMIRAETLLTVSQTITFELDENQIFKCETSTFPFRLGIGRFAGRHQGIYRSAGPVRKIFSYVIAGAFEVEDRLLQMRDGLLIPELEELEFEALSPNAVLFFIESFI